MAKARSFLPQPPEARAASDFHWESPEFQKSYPAVFALLATAKVDGEARQGATITIFADGGRIKASVFDRHTNQSLFLSLDSPLGVWEEVERYVVSHPDEWREKPSQSFQRGRRA